MQLDTINKNHIGHSMITCYSRIITSLGIRDLHTIKIKEQTITRTIEKLEENIIIRLEINESKFITMISKSP